MKIAFFNILLLAILYCLRPAVSLTEENIKTTLLNELNRTKIRENLEFLTLNPHLSGTGYNNLLGDHLASQWEQYGFDSVEKVVYEVLLSYPDLRNPNTVQLLNADGHVIFTSKYVETGLRPEEDHRDVIPMFNAFAPNGTVEGDLLYVNYATPDDFKTLIKLGVNVTGKVVIARYGEIFRGNKVRLASQYGASGIILFSDPFQFAQNGESAEHVYPNSEWLPGSGAQRGSVSIFKGDFQTPHYPSLNNVYRGSGEDVDYPKIPCQPIGYQDAKVLLSRLGGFVAPEKWRNGHVSFHIGPGFVGEIAAKKVRLSVHNQLIPTNITNVIGTIKGSVEPDRYVLAGNHRDAWVFGAIDPSTGTAQMMEVARVFGQLLNKGWQPRRTIILCSWDAEEFALTGSYEWVEDNLIKLTHRAVAYINTDVCVFGQVFAPSASPILTDLLFDVSKEIPSPSNESQSLYDSWLEDSVRLGRITPSDEIRVAGLGGGSDHVPFFTYAGVPAIDLTFEIDKGRYRTPFSAYPTYHTSYDTFNLVNTFSDPEYRQMGACGHLNLFLLYELAEVDLLPFNISRYRNSIIEAFNELRSDGILDFLANKSVKIDHLKSSLDKFVEETEAWEERFTNFTSENPILIRAINDQLMQLDKAFLKFDGVPQQPQYRHMVFSLSMHNMYGSSSFPGIRDLLHEIMSHPQENDSRWLQLEKHISDLIVAFHSAADILKPLHIV